MELKEQPETEVEYWEIIEELGGFIWQMKHDLSHGRIEDPDGSINKEIASAREIQERLITELAEKFEVIHPKDCPKVEPNQEPPPAPEGKTYYWDWYKKMNAEVYSLYYERLICSACPFSEGLERMISLGNIPCSVWPGALYQLPAPHICGMVGSGSEVWTEERLHSEILSQHSEEALTAFKAKEKKLKPSTEKVSA